MTGPDRPGLPIERSETGGSDPRGIGDPGSPVFREPWEAQAFAMAVRLHEAGHFTWGEWAAALAEHIRQAQVAGDPDLGDTYYRHWLAALERLVVAKGLVSADELAHRKAEWDAAARATPHGQPIELSR